MINYAFIPVSYTHLDVYKRQVMYACETIRDVSKIDKELKKYLKEIKEKIFE